MIIGITGAVTGRVKVVRPHPDGQRIWLADVCLSINDLTPVQIVFGGDRKLRGGELVPVAPPGSRATVLRPDGSHQRKKMRVRRYRGERSHGMLCSLDELGWIRGGPNEVAILRYMAPGDSLDKLPKRRRTKVATDWARAKQMTKKAGRRRLRLLLDRLSCMTREVAEVGSPEQARALGSSFPQMDPYLAVPQQVRSGSLTAGGS